MKFKCCRRASEEGETCFWTSEEGEKEFMREICDWWWNLWVNYLYDKEDVENGKSRRDKKNKKRVIYFGREKIIINKNNILLK